MHHQRAQRRLFLVILIAPAVLSLLGSIHRAQASAQPGARVRAPVANSANRYLRPGDSTSFPPLVSQSSTPGLVTGGGAVSSACIINPATNNCGGVGFTIPNEGTWGYVSSSRVATFTALATATGTMTPITYRVIHSSPSDGTVTSTLTAIVDPTLTVPVLINDYSSGSINSSVSRNILTNDSADNRTQLDPSSIRSCGSSGMNPATCTGTTYSIPQGSYSINFTNGIATFTPNNGYVGTPLPLRYIVRDMLGQLSSNIGSYYPTLSTTTNSSSSTSAPTANTTSTTIASGAGTTGSTVFNSESNGGSNPGNSSGNSGGTSSATNAPSNNPNKEDVKRTGDSNSNDSGNEGSSDVSTGDGIGSPQILRQEIEKNRNKNLIHVVTMVVMLLALFTSKSVLIVNADCELKGHVSENKTRERLSSWFTLVIGLKRERKKDGRSLFSTPEKFEWREGSDDFIRRNNIFYRAVVRECRTFSRLRIFRPGIIRIGEIAYFSPLMAIILQMGAMLFGVLLATSTNGTLGPTQATSIICFGLISPLLAAFAFIGWMTVSFIQTSCIEALSASLVLFPGVFLLPLVIKGLIGPRDPKERDVHRYLVFAAAISCHLMVYLFYFTDFDVNGNKIVPFLNKTARFLNRVFGTSIGTFTGQIDVFSSAFIPYALTATVIAGIGASIFATLFSNSNGDPIPLSKPAKLDHVKRAIDSSLHPISETGFLTIAIRYIISFSIIAFIAKDFPLSPLLLAFLIFIGMNSLIHKKSPMKNKPPLHPVWKTLSVLLFGLLLKMSAAQFGNWQLLILLAVMSSLPNLLKTRRIWNS